MRPTTTLPLLTAAALSLSACSTLSETERAAYLDAQTEIASRPTLEIDCPRGCAVAYTDPRDRQIRMPTETNGWDAAIAISDGLLGAATSLGPWYGVTALGVEAVNAVSDAQGPTRVHNGDTIGGDRIGGDVAGGDQIGGDYAGPVRGDTVGGDMIGGDRVVNEGRIDSPDDHIAEPVYPPTDGEG
ncbi:hypothetical protein [Arhodomonas sp. AD133]|uniref:hypothetical protein n=1 Tax=Arhodomonas sp. AD133 TaxID=3415009 RepID=UPI003EBC6FF9